MHDATATISDDLAMHPWTMLHSQADRLHGAHCLIGMPTTDLRAHADYLLLTSSATSLVLNQMDIMIRELNTAIEDDVELSMMSVRGPILWSETMTARAHSFGNEDVYMCRVTARTFNTAENRFILATLQNLVTTFHRFSQTALWHELEQSERDHLHDEYQLARKWSQHTRLSKLSKKPIRSRELTTIRHSPRNVQFEPFLELHNRRLKLFTTVELNAMADATTREYLHHVAEVANAVGLMTRLPARWSVKVNGLVRGELSFRHPRATGASPHGISLRGIVVPADGELERQFVALVD